MDRAKDQSFTGFGHANSHQSHNMTGVVSEVDAGLARVIVAYSAAAKTYTLTFGGDTVVFGPEDSVGTYAYESEDGRFLAAYVPQDDRIQYMGWGQWLSTERNDATNTTEYVSRAFIYGTPTVNSDLPRTGSAEFYSSFSAGGRNGSEVLSFFSQGFLKADFALGNLSGQLPIKVYAGGPDPIQTFNFTFTGGFQPGSNGISGALRSSDSAYAGKFVGAFYGPSAREIGLTTEFTDGNVKATGIVVGLDQEKQLGPF